MDNNTDKSLEEQINDYINNLRSDKNREKALALVNAWFDKKTILVKDPERGVKDWVSIYDPNYWTFLAQFCENVNKYRILEEE